MSEHPGKNLEVSPLKRALIAVKDLTTRLEKAERARHEPIAIVGMGCRFPGARWRRAVLEPAAPR